VVFSGGGFHVYWFLQAPLPAQESLARAEAMNKGIGQALHGDSVSDASRIFRIPGTFNCKQQEPKSVTLVRCDPKRRYDLADFADYQAHTSRTAPRTARPVTYGEIGGTPCGRAALAGELARLAQEREGSHYRNIALNKAAFSLGRLVGAGHLDRDLVEAHLYQVGVNIGLPKREVKATLKSGLSAGVDRGAI
jgi:hypothetical protein